MFEHLFFEFLDEPGVFAPSSFALRGGSTAGDSLLEDIRDSGNRFLLLPERIGVSIGHFVSTDTVEESPWILSVIAAVVFFVILPSINDHRRSS